MPENLESIVSTEIQKIPHIVKYVERILELQEGAVTIDVRNLEQKCKENAEIAAKKAIQSVAPDLMDTLETKAHIISVVRNALMRTLRSFVSIDVAARTIVALRTGEKSILTVANIDTALKASEERFFSIGTRIAKAVDAGAIQPILRKYGNRIYQVVRVGQKIYVRAIPATKVATPVIRRVAMPATKAAKGAFIALSVVGTGLAAYEAYSSMEYLHEEVQLFAKQLSSEGKDSITDSIASIVEHGRNQHAKIAAEDAAEVQLAVEQKNVAAKLIQARNIAVSIHAMINTYQIKPAPKNKSFTQTMGDLAAQPTGWLAEKMWGDPNQLRTNERRSRILSKATNARKLLQQIQGLPQNNESQKTAEALAMAIQFGERIAKQGGKVNTSELLSKIRAAQQAASRKSPSRPRQA